MFMNQEKRDEKKARKKEWNVEIEVATIAFR